jgi:hypothetical protein
MHHNNKSGHYSTNVTINSTDYQNPSSIDSPKWGRHDQHNSALVVKTASTRKYAAKSSARHVRLPAFDRPLHVNNLLLAQLRVKDIMVSSKNRQVIPQWHYTQGSYLSDESRLYPWFDIRRCANSAKQQSPLCHPE